jgi:uncharacterized protein YkwD
MTETTIDRRRLLILGGGALALAPFAGCVSRGPSGDSVRMTRDGAPLFADIRSSNSLGAISADRELETAAVVQAGYMAQAGRMAHDTGIGRSFQTRMGSVKTNGAAAENLARGRMDLVRVMDIWMNSPGHRRNMLDPKFARFGLGYVTDPRDPAQRYWAMVLAA